MQFCEGDVNTRVESWDGIPLDVNVTLPPAAMTGPFPLIIEHHGWAGSKSGADVSRALAGYVVLSYTARGFHASCGDTSSRFTDNSISDPTACADRGWIHLSDIRYEGRDSQYLAGMLVDEGHVIADAIGAFGASYGGMRSMILAMLKNRTMLPDGTLVPWTSPLGTPMQLAAAVPLIPPSDLANALQPNGGTLDYRIDNPYGPRVGVFKEQWVNLLFATGAGVGYYAPIGVDPGADLVGWRARLNAGEPYDGDPEAQAIIDEIVSFHSAYYIDDSIEPAPMLVYNSWTDDLFPADEGVRIWRKVKDTYPSADVSLHFADAFGHLRADLDGDTARVFARMTEFFDFYLKGAGAPVPALEVYTQDCGGSTEAGPFTAADWDAIHPGEIVFADDSLQTIDQDSGDSPLAGSVAPIGSDPCRSIPPGDDATTANYTFDATASGYTMIGAPTVIAEYDTAGAEFAQVAARLWDVAADGTQYLVTHGFYRPRFAAEGRQVFQLPPNGWEFAPGHAPKLELLGQSNPSGRASNGAFYIEISNVELRLPVMDAAGGEVTAPLTAVLPPETVESPACQPAPEDVCVEPTSAGGSKVVLKRPKPGKEKLLWKWGKGPAVSGAEFGAGLASRGYSLCIYNADVLEHSLKIPFDGDCGDKPCWRSKASGDKLLYADKDLTRTATFKVKMAAGEAGKASIKILGKGTKLALPSLPVSPMPATVQLIDGDGGCWGATYSVPRPVSSKAWGSKSD